MCFLSSCSVALLISYFTGSIVNEIRFILFFMISTGIFSLLHSLKYRKSFSLFASDGIRSLLLQIIFIGLSITAILSGSTGFFICASVAGLILLFFIDNSFSPGPERTKLFFHGGQTILTGLLMISFLSMLMIPFLFISVIKLVSGIYYLLKFKADSNVSGLRFLRIMLLLISGSCLLTRIAYPDYLITFLFFCGELIERILFYYDYDFDSENSFTDNSSSIKIADNEKEGS